MIGQLLESGNWDPFAEMRQLQRQMNRLFERHYPGSVDFPPVNIWTNEDDVVLTAEIPGVNVDDLDISVQGNVLTLKGSQKEEQLNENETYHRRERATGNFQRSWRLPFNVDKDNIDAKLEKGVLKLTLPRAEQDKPKKIEVKS